MPWAQSGDATTRGATPSSLSAKAKVEADRTRWRAGADRRHEITVAGKTPVLPI